MSPTQFVVPDPNVPDSLDAHRRQVFDAYGTVFDLVDSALRYAVPQATDIFALLGGPVDLAVHASLTRYVVRESLAGRELSVEDEELDGYELDRIANCGLCIRFGACEVRVLKAASGGIPKASSEARSRFYRSNQGVLRFGDGQAESQVRGTPIGLVVLWSINKTLEYQGLQIACPRAERRDKSVDCYWIAPWNTRQSISLNPPPESESVESDLDDIRALEDGREAKGS